MLSSIYKQYSHTFMMLPVIIVISILSLYVNKIGSFSVFWPVNGIILGFFLFFRFYKKDLLINAFLMGSSIFLGNFIAGDNWKDAIFFASINIAEVLILNYLFFKIFENPVDKIVGLDIRNNGFWAVLLLILIPLIFGLIYSTYLTSLKDFKNFINVFQKWYFSDTLGLILFTAATLSLYINDKKNVNNDKKDTHNKKLVANTLLFFINFLVSILIFDQKTYPFLFLIFPCLTLSLFSSGYVMTLINIIVTMFVGIYFTLNEMGPLWINSTGTLSDRLSILQFFIAVALLQTIPFSILFNRKNILEQELQSGKRHYQLLAEESADMIVLSNLKLEIIYISPLAEHNMQNLKIPHTMTEIVQEEDRLRFLEQIKNLNSVDQEIRIEHRIKIGNSYYWAEALCKCVANPNNSDLNIIFSYRNIDDRKIKEQNEHTKNEKLTSMAFVDELTQVANRRAFNDDFSLMWSKSAANNTNISVIMIDIDFFKKYNDYYGHLQGDEVLKSIGVLFKKIIKRDGEKFYRFGGEEFVIILSNYNEEKVEKLASDILFKMHHTEIEHLDSPFGRVTLSLGLSTVKASFNQQATTLLNRADNALYRAKQSGRNQYQTSK